MNTAMTTVEISDDGKTAEITQKLYAHDLEQVFGLDNARLDYFETKEGSAKLNEYISSKFRISSISEVGGFKFIGAQCEFDIVYAFYETPIDSNVPLIIQSNLLFESNPHQQNFVNIHYQGRVVSHIFQKANKSVSILLEKGAW